MLTIVKVDRYLPACLPAQAEAKAAEAKAARTAEALDAARAKERRSAARVSFSIAQSDRSILQALVLAYVLPTPSPNRISPFSRP